MLSQITDDVDVETLLVPKELITPLKDLIAKMCLQLQNKSPKLDIGPLTNIGGSQDDTKEQTKTALSMYRELKDKLHKILKTYSHEEVIADLPSGDFNKFKDLRKSLTQWFRLGDACTKRSNADLQNAHQIIHCKVTTSPSLMSPELRARVLDKMEATRASLEEDLELKLIDELITKTTQISDELEAVGGDKRLLLVFAKAFRATLSNGDGYRSKSYRHSTPNNSKNVSFRDHTFDTASSSRSKKGKSILKRNYHQPRDTYYSESDSDSSPTYWEERRKSKHERGRPFHKRRAY